MKTKFVLGRSYEDAKCMAQNRTTSRLAVPNILWVGLHGTSIEGANLAVINKRKPPTEYELSVYSQTAFSHDPDGHSSQVLDQVWPGDGAVIVL